MEENYFAANNQRFKKVCPNTICPTNCNSMFYVHARHRWCYDENYSLKSDQHERVRVNGKTSNVMTGIIGIINKSSCTEQENDFYAYEQNMLKYSELVNDNTLAKGIERVADIYGIKANSLTISLIRELK